MFYIWQKRFNSLLSSKYHYLNIIGFKFFIFIPIKKLIFYILKKSNLNFQICVKVSFLHIFDHTPSFILIEYFS